MERRTFLAVGGCLALSGCLGIGSGPKTEIAWIELSNHRTSAYDVEVRIERGDEEVYTDSLHLDGGPDTSTVRIEGPVDGRGRYTVGFDVGGQYDHLDPDEYADVTEDCLGIRYELHSHDRDEDYSGGTRAFDLQPIQEC